MDDKNRRPGSEVPPAGTDVPPRGTTVPPGDSDVHRVESRRTGYGRPYGGNSALALIVGALAVAIIIGAFFWFSRDTGDTVAIDQGGVTTEERALESPQTPPAQTGEEPATTPPGQTTD